MKVDYTVLSCLANYHLQKKFKHWITKEVLPTIRKTGGYINDESLFLDTYLPFADQRTKTLFSAILKETRQLNQKLKQQEPLVQFAKTVQGSKHSILVRETSKLASNHAGIYIGEKQLYQKLRDWGFILKTRNEPSSRAYKQGLIEYIVRTVEKGGKRFIVYTSVITPKGQQYFINRLIAEYQEVEV